MSPPLTAPGYLPAQAVDVLPWTRKYVAGFAAREHVDLDDCWQAAIAALIRATVHYEPRARHPRSAFQAYASQAVRTALWRVVGYWLRGRFVRHHQFVVLEPTWLGPLAPSAEEEAIARDSVRARL